MKIVITGGLGYIGSELCKLYSGESRLHNIVVLDKKFVSERVKQLRDWSIGYDNVSIMDVDALRRHMSDADVVIHLAGVTDVAYTKTQSNAELDKDIWDTGVIGTQNVLDAIPSHCKVVFPSTHVVFEGFSETKEQISEEEVPCPVLTYARSKYQSEQDIQARSNDYVILRLASVYGYSTDTMRIGIMPNLFSKIASLDGTIKMFSGGIQLKSLVSVYDVARCMKMMAENAAIHRETFHLSSESTSVREVAEKCKAINPALTLVTTDDEIPNRGYTISNEKLKKTGFKFLYTLDQCLIDMIGSWSKRNINPALEYTDRGGKEFVDDRGIIVNYELTEPINLIGHITSCAGAVRANHYHPVQEQKCLLISGAYVSVTKDLLVPDAPLETRLILPGDIAIIKPNVAHAMVFLENSVFLNLVRGEREHENYGITHTIPYRLVDDDLRDKLMYSYARRCRSCGREQLKDVVSLGMSPLANNLKNSASEKDDLYPLEIKKCPLCHNCQLSVDVPSEKMFSNYLYVSSTSPKFVKHFETAAESYIRRFGLNSSSFVVDVGSNDGVALKPFIGKGITNVLGIEPAVNLANLAKASGIPTTNSYFNRDTTRKIKETYPDGADLILASNVFAHAADLKEMAQAARMLLKDDGVFIVEVQYLMDTIKDLTFDNIYHEHFNYWSLTSIVLFFENLKMKVVDVERIDTHGGSIRVFVKKSGAVDSRVQTLLNEEKSRGVHKMETYNDFAARVLAVREKVRAKFAELKSTYGKIVAYGAPAKATTALNFFGIDNTIIDYIIEDNSLKHGKYVPGVNIPIVSKQYALEDKGSKCLVVLAWNFYDVIVAGNKDLVESTSNICSIKHLY